MKRALVAMTIYDGDTERVMLRSDVFPLLKQRADILLLIKGQDRVDAYRKEFESEGVKVALLPPADSLAERVWWRVGWAVLPTQSSRERAKFSRLNSGNWLLYGIDSLLWLLGHTKIFRSFLRYIYTCTPDDYGTEILKKHKPDILFAPNMFSPEDMRLLRQAKRMGIHTVTYSKSWDVLTSKGFTRVIAERILVNNRYDVDSVTAFGEYSKEQVFVVGYPQFDRYTQPLSVSRDEFLVHMGIKSNARFVLLGVPGEWQVKGFESVLKKIDEAITFGALPKDLVVLGRLHPKYGSPAAQLQYRHVVFYRPGKTIVPGAERSLDLGQLNAHAWRFGEDDIQILQASLVYAEAVLSPASTLTLDALACKAPVFLLGFDIDTQEEQFSSAAWYKRDHNSRIVNETKVPLLKNMDECIAALSDCLKDRGAVAATQGESAKDLIGIPGSSSRTIVDRILSLYDTASI